MIYSPPCRPRCPCLSFFSRKEIKVFDENLPRFYNGLQCEPNGSWSKKTVSVQTVQRALNDSRRSIRVLSSEKIAHLINKNKV